MITVKWLIRAIILVHITSSCVWAQQNETEYHRLINQATSNMLYAQQYTNTEGSPFLNDKWLKGKIYLNDGSSFNNLLCKFDAFNNKFIVNKNDTSFETSPAVQQVQLYPTDDTSNVLTFKKGFSINQEINENKFLQVLASGKISFLKLNFKKLQEYTEYGTATKLKRFQAVSQYFVFIPAQYNEAVISKKNLEDLLADKWPQVLPYLSANKLSGKDEKSWSAAITYYNSLK